MDDRNFEGVGHLLDLKVMIEILTPQTFTYLFCRNEQSLTPHRAGQVLAQHGPVVELEVYCRRCGNRGLYETSELPEGHRIYKVRVTGEDNLALPADLRPLPYLEEDLVLLASSAQDAHEQACLTQRLRFSGHLVRYYIDEVEHLDERF